MQKAAHAYLQTNLSTDSPCATVLALYGGAVTFLTQAKESMGVKDYARKGILISKAMDILNELSSVLNREKGGEIAENLRRLYFWCNTQLAVANMRMDASIIDKVIVVLNGLRDAFEQIQNTPDARDAERQISSRQSYESHQPQARLFFMPQQGQPEAAHNVNLRGRSLYGKASLNRAAE